MMVVKILLGVGCIWAVWTPDLGLSKILSQVLLRKVQHDDDEVPFVSVVLSNESVK